MIRLYYTFHNKNDIVFKTKNMKNKYPIYVAIPIQYSFLTFISFKWSLPDNQNVKQTSPYSSFKLYFTNYILVFIQVYFPFFVAIKVPLVNQVSLTNIVGGLTKHLQAFTKSP